MEGHTLCLGGNSASALTPPPQTPPLRVSQVLVPPPEMLKTTPTGYLKGLLRKGYVVSPLSEDHPEMLR